MARPIDIKVTLDLPNGVEFLETERVGDGHGIEVKVPLPDAGPCEARGRKDWATYDNWKTGILKDVDGRYTSAAVESINNKGRVITMPCTGVAVASVFRNQSQLPPPGDGCRSVVIWAAEKLTTAMQWPSVCQSSVQLIDNEVAGVLVSSEEGDLGALEMFPPEAHAEAVHIVLGSQLRYGKAEDWSVIDQNISLSAGQRG